ncbi:MAG: hypothetical protein RI556_02460 [Hydrogenovibrio sp.]|uniref:hypothetical protein n=1 Tax=Hydrogenovibrio TaxID=28884 RepID=UPI00036CDCA0|nr:MULTISPECIES: hypothetical protein [Hydrogenovibrio]MDR9498012.1 hypothetical protein [Hydrogenovibrio sp.]
MIIQFDKHAKEVVKEFKSLLSDKALREITDEQFSELETLVLASVEVVHSNMAHKAAKSLESLAHDLRKEAGHVE